MKYKFLLYSIVAFTSNCFGQLDSLQVLNEVILNDVKLRDFATGIHQTKIADSIIERQPTQLTQIIRFNSLIYLRENGPGGVSSASFRGTNASQTAVVWNGLNINSQFTGQTDFNAIAGRNYDDITIRSGGGSIPYGTGAVGGSIHLNNTVGFQKNFKNKIALGYGSFNTPTGHLKSTFSTEKFYIDGALDYISSDNDFDYLETDQNNENGDYDNINLNLNTGLLIGKHQSIKLFHNTYFGDRGFSGTLTAVSNSGFEDRNTRSLLQWEVLGNHFESQLRLAHVFEQFRFFLSRSIPNNFSIGKAIRYTANYQGKYKFSKGNSLQAIIDYTNVTGDGSSIPGTQTRITFSPTLLWNQQLNDRWQYSLQLRQDATSDFNSPFLVGLGSEYRFSDSYTLKLNASRNYRLPTFNDLFFSGPGGLGNPDILPETSWQGELGHQFKFKNISGNLQTFYIRSRDLIVYVPNSQGVFSPINVSDVENYGAELALDYTTTFQQHQLHFSGKYGYTVARNVEQDLRLILVPEQKIVGAIAYQYKTLSAFYQFLYNDEVFTTTDNTTTLAGYAVSNVGVDYTLFQKKDHNIIFSFKVNNLLNRNYQVIAFRPNPGRNFLIQTTYNF